ncbi:Predicted TonB-dependent receptor [uncultured Desulfobacterium sp.]|uniref:Predicted TonB-dependent receptor n=1 Tax=uncultured Desulfobacterium sp. TaxID=201089 RepID=A0A445N1B2_9BACT|nr:Predicted TonB-dependent receptor [uncultured Desulfobacterium sp.]
MRSRLKTKAILYLLILLCSTFVGLGWAEEKVGDAEKESNVFDLGEVVVSGESSIISQVATVETLDREQLDLTNSTDLSSALETLPGVHVATGQRNEAYLNVRGFNQKYVPIFYDGIPWYIPNDGYVDSSEIPTGNLSQVTLTKGAASVLYGPNTMGGVINIISMKPQKAFEGSYGAEANRSGYLGNLNLGSKMDKFYFMGGVSGLDYGDYRMSHAYSPKPANRDGWYEDGYKRDNSDIESLSETLKMGIVPSEGHEYAVGFHHVRSDEKGWPTNVYPSESVMYRRFADWEKKTYYFIGDSRITDQLSAKTRLYHDQYFNVLDAYDDETFTTQNARYAFHSTYDDHTDGGSIVLKSEYIEDNTTSASFHYKKDTHKEQDDYGASWERYESKMFSYGLENETKLTDNFGFVLGTSYDVQDPKYANGDEVRSNEEAWNLLGGAHYTFEDATRLHFSVAKKTRFPTLNELYSSYLGSVTPNPNLKKEQSVNYETGIQRPLPWESIAGFTLFYSDVEDLINRRTLPDRTTITENIGQSRFRGFELSAKTNGLPLNTLEAHYTYLDSENRSDDRTSSHLSEIPKYQLYMSDLLTVTDWFSLYAKAEYNRKQWAQKRDQSWVDLDDYWVVDLKAMADLYDMATFEVGVRNIFDENYETSYGFPREGREAFCGIRGSF